MSEHAFAVASGFGLRVVPARGAFRFRHAAGASELVVECRHADGWRAASIAPAPGEPDVRLGDRTTSLSEVARVEGGPDAAEWWVETAAFRIPLASDWTVSSTGARDDHVPFELQGAGAAAISVWRPRRMPSLESLLGPGQQFRDTGQLSRAAWIEFDYTHDGAPWLDRHELFHRGLTPFVVALRAPAAVASGCGDVLADIVERLEPTKTAT